MATIGALFDAFVSGMEDEAQRILVIIGAAESVHERAAKSALGKTMYSARRVRWRSMPRPYIARLRLFNRLICPSVWPPPLRSHDVARYRRHQKRG
jgi:hypothetical protein